MNNTLKIALKQAVFNQYHGQADDTSTLIFWKNVHSVYFGCNANLALLAGFKNSTDVIGLTDNELIWDDYACTLYQTEDRLVCDSRLSLKEQKVPYLRRDTGYNGQLVGTKEPLFDRQQQLIGIVGYYKLLPAKQTLYDKINPAQMPTLLGSKTQFFVYVRARLVLLTRRESEVLLYLIIGCTCKQVAANMEISSRTIDSYFVRQLKKKLGCQSLSQIVQTGLAGKFLANFE